MTNTDGDVKVYNWTKDGLINKERGTVSAYKIVDLGKDRYLISEWKSGDYVYGGKIFGYYVYKKIKYIKLLNEKADYFSLFYVKK